MNKPLNSPRIKITKSSKSLLWHENEVWLIVGLTTGKVYEKFRLKSTALEFKPKIENIHLEKCVIVFDAGVTPKLNNRKPKGI